MESTNELLHDIHWLKILFFKQIETHNHINHFVIIAGQLLLLCLE